MSTHRVVTANTAVAWVHLEAVSKARSLSLCGCGLCVDAVVTNVQQKREGDSLTSKKKSAFEGRICHILNSHCVRSSGRW